MMRRSLRALFCVVLVTLQSDDASAEFRSIGQQAARIGEHIVAGASRFRTDIRNKFQPQLNTGWLDRDDASVVGPVRTCDGLVDASIILDCHLGGVQVNCSTPAQVGTVAVMTCASGYKPSYRHGYNRTTCNATLVWSKELITCIPDCGRQNAVGAQWLHGEGDNGQVGEFTWHVGVYQLDESRLYTQICGGSLITPAFVITAAQCFWDVSTKKVRVKEQFSIAAGKYKIDWYTDDREIQRRNLSEIHLGPRFSGESKLWAYDIALLRLDGDIKLSRHVNTICLDFRVDLENSHLQPGKNGSISGWGFVDPSEPSDALKSVQLPYIPGLDCESIVEARFVKYLTHDKFCAGYRNTATTICPGDSGGGYTFPQETVDGTRFYLRGIASVGHRARGNTGRCQTEKVAVVTGISEYRNWIENIVYSS